VRRKSVPNKAKNTSMMATDAPVKRGFSKKCMSSMGWSLWSSHATNVPSTTVPTANATSTGPCVQPCDGASMIP
jgi:hypothetical protein